VLMNGVGFTNAMTGNGFFFDGGTSCVQLPLNLLPFANAAPFSIELWFETIAGGAILAQQSATAPDYPASGWLPMLYVGTDGHLYVQLFWDGVFNQISTSYPVNDGHYHHLAVTYDGLNEVAYFDGAAIGSKQLQFSNFTANFSCQFGTGYSQYWPAGNSGWFSFKGVIDHPSLYSTVLTAAQVKSIYNAGGAGKCSDELLPVIVTQPTNQTVVPGATAVFSVGAVSLLPLTYQWSLNASPIANATNAICLAPNVSAFDSGSRFTCAISTTRGSIATSAAVLIVSNTIPAPGINSALPSSDGVQLTLSGPPGAVFRILGSVDLRDWETIAIVTNDTGVKQFTDSAATNFNRRFYRIVMP
jgi:hypothetical protein